MSRSLPTSSATVTHAGSLARRIHELGRWFHNIDLGGVKTAPDHFLGDYPAVKWRAFAHALPTDLGGRTVLDIGCNGGFYSIEMKRRGAGAWSAIDSDERYLAQARFAAETSRPRDRVPPVVRVRRGAAGSGSTSCSSWA
jgi:tRNA (mo5U34)-methyltransferase